VEVKLSETAPSPSWRKFAGLLPCRRGIQIVRHPGWKIHNYQDTEIIVAGASEILAHLV